MKVLLIEDDSMLAKALIKALRGNNFIIDHFLTCDEGYAAVEVSNYDCLLIDIGLPDGSGITLAQKIRQKSEAPIIFLTAFSDIENKLRGFDVGADDYITKPFNAQELIARIKAVLKRREKRSAEVLKIEPYNLKINFSKRAVHLFGVETNITKKEFLILERLIKNRGKIVSLHSLENDLYSFEDEYSRNAIEVALHRLKKKLPNEFIKNKRGEGYYIEL